jgi:cytochrome bd-type quinol oxidase subunit 2
MISKLFVNKGFMFLVHILFIVFIAIAIVLVQGFAFPQSNVVSLVADWLVILSTLVFIPVLSIIMSYYLFKGDNVRIVLSLFVFVIGIGILILLLFPTLYPNAQFSGSQELLLSVLIVILVLVFLGIEINFVTKVRKLKK